jgi:hypothetical protein
MSCNVVQLFAFGDVRSSTTLVHLCPSALNELTKNVLSTLQEEPETNRTDFSIVTTRHYLASATSPASKERDVLSFH